MLKLIELIYGRKEQRQKERGGKGNAGECPSSSRVGREDGTKKKGEENMRAS